MVAAIAGRLRRMGLPVDAVIGVQMPNIVENILAMLGVLRAGMVVAPLPLLWRRADAVAALARVGAKALITCGRVGDFKHGQFGMRVAAEVFAIRYVCGFGANLPDGVVPFDDLFTADKLDPDPAARARAAGQCRGAPCGDHLRRERRRPRAGGAQSFRTGRRRRSSCCSRAVWRRTPTSSRRSRPPRSPV